MIEKCVNCKSKNIEKRGFRHNKVGNKQKYHCLICNKWFIEPDGFERMRHQKEDIVRAIHLHNKGLSLFDAKDHLWQHDRVKVSRETIRKWCVKYSVFLKSGKFIRANVTRKTTSG